MKTPFDLLSLSPSGGGCTAKLDPALLENVLSGVRSSLLRPERVLVDNTTRDDAGVYRISDDLALIFTTDFFPAPCSDPYTYGRIAAANALSDVYAMGGEPFVALSLLMYPASKAPMEALAEIVQGGQDVLDAARCFVLGGHTIEDDIPKYGFAVTGRVDPKMLMTNAAAEPEHALVLTKPLGTGVIMAARRLGLVSDSAYRIALESMCALNDRAAAAARKYGVRAATDITGFGLIGHAMQMADAADISIRIETSELPLLPEVECLVEQGCIPGGAFRNVRYAGGAFENNAGSSAKFYVADPQTSGGLLLVVHPDCLDSLLADLPGAVCIGRTLPRAEKAIYLF